MIAPSVTHLQHDLGTSPIAFRLVFIALKGFPLLLLSQMWARSHLWGIRLFYLVPGTQKQNLSKRPNLASLVQGKPYGLAEPVSKAFLPLSSS